VSANLTTGGEQGLLGMAFSPDGSRLYASFTDGSGDSNVVAYPFSAGVARMPGRRILFVHQPFSNHNGGNIVFGPDGFLYFGLGDGGSEGDPLGTGQDLGTLLGKMLRIDPTPDGARPYAIPLSNPFVGRHGARAEIWAYGLRNPWRFSFDRRTGDLWIGDVGQNTWEEIDEQTAGRQGGQNYGWSCFEGFHGYRGCRPAHAAEPVYEYSHDSGGCAVDGGHVYRGSAIPALVGAYVFGDYCQGRLIGLIREGGRARTWRLGPTVSGLDSFGQDANGELYAMSLEGGLYRLVP
jgi:glucose/arabinose dehydrogenase